MIKSMTAFAREQEQTDLGTLTVELRSVNHRYLDCSFKLPEELRALEPKWREQLRTTLGRGKVECLARWQTASAASPQLSLDHAALKALSQACAEVVALAPQANQPTTLDLLQWPGILSGSQSSAHDQEALANSVFEQALHTLQASREREGKKMAELIKDRLAQVEQEVMATRERVPELIARQQSRIQERLSALQSELDPSRLEQELVLLAQKADVDEELDRLGAHVSEVARVLAAGGPCGRRLDFLMQELNREANTLSSKSISSATTQNAVELKVLIEQMREQIQNLE